jgi:hypothetical protein
MYVVTVHGSNHQKHISHKVKSQQQRTNVKQGELMTTSISRSSGGAALLSFCTEVSIRYACVALLLVTVPGR